MRKLIYLYILKCSDNSFYVGVTNSLTRRLAEHQSGYNPGSYTYDKRPVEIVYTCEFQEFLEAFATEKRIKKWSHAKKQALIDGNEDELVRLSKKKFRKKEG